MDTSQIWRFPKKYAELFKNISNEDIGKIIKGLFLDEIEDLEGLNKAYYDIIKVDLQNLEKSALNGKKGGRPKKETGGYENKKPEVIENENLKERKRERERKREDKENNNITILDKSNIEQSSDIVVSDNRNEDINEMQEFIKETIESFHLSYKPGKQERNRIHNICTAKHISELCEKTKLTKKDFIYHIIKASNTNKFFKQIFNAVDFYANYTDVYNKMVSAKIKQQTKQEKQDNIIYSNEF